MASFKDNAEKELLTTLPSDEQGVRAFLSAAAKQGGFLHIVGRRRNLVFNLASYEQCIAVIGLLKMLYPSEFEMSAEHIRSGMKKGGTSFSVSVPTGFTAQAVEDLRLAEGGVPSFVRNSRSAAESYLKGLFMVCGSVYVPSPGGDEEKREGYHFEFAVDGDEFAEEILQILADLGVQAKVSERGALRLVYIKDKESILSALALLGLSESVLKLKSIIDERETANSINRVTICEAANLDKSYAAASRQLMAIGAIEESVGLDSLSATLRDTANARMEYPLASMSELADILGVSKSCLNHRLRKLAQLAAENGFGEE